jgi:hypothetical protein
MNETTLQWIQFGKLIALAVFGLLYGLGGVDGKWKRRFVAPVVFGGSLCGLAALSGHFHWGLTAYIPLLIAALHMGYGAATTETKIVRRAIYGTGLAIAMLPFAIVTGHWALFAFGCVGIIGTSVVFGVWNITSSARAEETAIATAAGFAVCWMV